ncbi:Protein ycf2 [Talaromyces islandicus]|uniref:Protein ycf2 n=1 Tax=Talaromyces islandicus TaxID=28573 RepID=A0A0U1LUV8_TALIS|nr:Protein ycf2 [Talaromyces islandicus]
MIQAQSGPSPPSDSTTNTSQHESSAKATDFDNQIPQIHFADTDSIPGHHICLDRNLSLKGQKALQSALYTANQVFQELEGISYLQNSDIIDPPSDNLSPEFITWMLQDISSDNFGCFVLDYFKHVSKESLKRMALLLLTNDGSSQEARIANVCVNGMAYKFLTTKLALKAQDELSIYLRERSFQYKRAGQIALSRIRLTSPPSLPLLQAVLCGIFLHQGSGDTQLCYELVKTACRICADIGLNKQPLNGREFSEEEYFCLLWCYMLDRNYAWKSGSSECFLRVANDIIGDYLDGEETSVSGLLAIYIAMARVQGETFAFQNGLSSMQTDTSMFREVLLPNIEKIQRKIFQLVPSSPEWTGLDARNEIAALEFACNSLKTTLFFITEGPRGVVFHYGEIFLESARQELSALLALCSTNDKQQAVAFLHWTLLYYPLTSYFALFCNAMTNFHIGDFNFLKAIADFLMQMRSLSQPISILQRLFEQFVLLSRKVFEEGDSLTLSERSTPMQQPPADYFASSHYETIPFCWSDSMQFLSQEQWEETDVSLSGENIFYPHSLLGDPAGRSPFRSV